MQYTGSCHCGAIRFAFDADPIARGLRCNCSMCVRKGATMSEFVVAPDAMHITVKDDALATYQFETETVSHHFCKRCGIYPFHVVASKPGHFRVNLGCIDELDASNLPFKVFDGQNI